MENKQTINKHAEIVKKSCVDKNHEELVKKNEKLADAVTRLKTFIKSSDEDFEKKEEEIKKKEEDIEKLEMENQKLKERLWDSKINIKDLIKTLHAKDAQVAEKDEQIEELQKEIKDGMNMDIGNPEAFSEIVENKEDDEDELEILETPTKLIEEVTLDEDTDNVEAEKIAEMTKVIPFPPTSGSIPPSSPPGLFPDSIPTTPQPSAPPPSRDAASNIGEKYSSLIAGINQNKIKVTVMCPSPTPAPLPGSSKSVSETSLKREKVVKDFQEALAIRQSAATDKYLSKRSTKDLHNIGKKIEKYLFRQFEDVSKKYLAKYRSIVQNIKNPQNQVLFRQILQSKISPRELVAMNTNDYAKVFSKV